MTGTDDNTADALKLENLATLTRQEPNKMPPDSADNVLHHIASDLDLLAKLHDQELDAAMVAALSSTPPEDWFALPPSDDMATASYQLLVEAFRLPDKQSMQTLVDNLASDYAAIYLTHTHRASPNESVWMTDDGLTNQEPMFEVRQWLQRYNLAVPDWRIRSDDHLVNQLVFLARLIRLGTPDSLRDAGCFLDQHLMNWIEDFSDSASSHCDTAFYAGLVLLTQAYVLHLRQLLEEITGEPRIVPKVIVPITFVDEAPNEAYVPGTQPGW
jgi:TorA maturation chaperone TorD